MPHTSFKRSLDRFCNWAEIHPIRRRRTATIAVTERYCRTVLHIKRRKPLRYRNVNLICIGSDNWRIRRYNQRVESNDGRADPA